jgi:hypothetical protein
MEMTDEKWKMENGALRGKRWLAQNDRKQNFPFVISHFSFFI